jgi:hypothetical protein
MEADTTIMATAATMVPVEDTDTRVLTVEAISRIESQGPTLHEATTDTSATVTVTTGMARLAETTDMVTTRPDPDTDRTMVTLDGMVLTTATDVKVAMARNTDAVAITIP